MSSCQHLEIHEGICGDCGLVMRGGFDKRLEYSNNHPQINIKTTENILDSIKGVPVEVKRRAKDNIVRNDRKNTFIELYLAYVDCGEEFNPNELAEKLGLSRKKVNKCLQEISGTSLYDHDYDKFPGIVLTSPKVYLDKFCEHPKIAPFREQIADELDKVLEENDMILSMKPNHVAAAVVRNFMENQGIHIKKFSSLHKISDPAINKVNITKTKYNYPKTVNIVDYKDFNPSTVTMTGKLTNRTDKSYIGNTTLNVRNISKFIPVTHLFNDGRRVKIPPNTRNKTPYQGIEGLILGFTYKKEINRGIRSSAMNNMVSLDMQLGGRNVHVKVSDFKISCVGAKSFENGMEIFEMTINHFKMLKNNIKYVTDMDVDKLKTNLEWHLKNCIKDGKLVRFTDYISVIENAPSSIDRKLIKILSMYLDEDYKGDEVKEYKEKIKELISGPEIYDGEINECEVSIYNSVYHVDVCDQDKAMDYKIPVHKLAIFFSMKGYRVEFHNFSSEGVIICIDIDEQKKSNDKKNKIYKHRITIHNGLSAKVVSPTHKDEAYKYYKEILGVIKEFVEGGCEIDI